MPDATNGPLPFSAVYVINLRRCTERWESVRSMLAGVGIDNPVRWDACDGRDLNGEMLERFQKEGRLSTDLSGFEPAARSGEIGCALSHQAVLEDVLKMNHECALILEDDAAIFEEPAEWRRRATAAFEDLPESWEIWFLFRCFDVRRRIRRLTSRTVIPYTPLCATSYAVTRDGAHKLLKATLPLKKAIDRVYVEDVVRKRKIRSFAASPPLFLPGCHPSLINADNPEKKWIKDGVNRPPEFWPDHYEEARVPNRWKRAALTTAAFLLLATLLVLWRYSG